MIGVDKIIELLGLVVTSGYIKGEQPVSALVTAPVEAGKTDMAVKLRGSKGCIILTDATAYGIMTDYGQQITRREIRHLIMPDLVKAMSRDRDTVHTLITFFNALLEEGIYRTATYAEHLQHNTPVKCGLIASIAKGVLLDGRHRWSQVGFISRMLPISYDYGAVTQSEIHKSIARRDYRSDKPTSLQLPEDDIEVKLPLKQADDLLVLSSGLTGVLSTSNKNAQRIYGFRLQKHIQRLAMASAIKEGRDKVSQSDVDKIKSLISCVNLEYYPI